VELLKIIKQPSKLPAPTGGFKYKVCVLASEDGVKRCLILSLVELAEIVGVPLACLRDRIRHLGWDYPYVLQKDQPRDPKKMSHQTEEYRNLSNKPRDRNLAGIPDPGLLEKKYFDKVFKRAK
jgi:hypothetical protein